MSEYILNSDTFFNTILLTYDYNILSLGLRIKAPGMIVKEATEKFKDLVISKG